MDVNRREKLMAVATVARLGITWGLVSSFAGEFVWTCAWMAAFLLADLIDGIVARKLQADGPVRRIADVIVDHISVTTAFIGAFVVYREYLVANLVIAWMALVIVKWSYSIPGILSFVRYRVLLRSVGPSNKVFNFGQVAIGMAIIYGLSPNVITWAVVSLAAFKTRISWASLVGYFRISRKNVDKQPLVVENHLPLLGKRTSRVIGV
jgi:phosphatidylglycerophosphate synthase